jgi:hypothetical protein
MTSAGNSICLPVRRANLFLDMLFKVGSLLDLQPSKDAAKLWDLRHYPNDLSLAITLLLKAFIHYMNTKAEPIVL